MNSPSPRLPYNVRTPPTRKSSRDLVSTLQVHPRPVDTIPGRWLLPSWGSRRRHFWHPVHYVNVKGGWVLPPETITTVRLHDLEQIMETLKTESSYSSTVVGFTNLTPVPVTRPSGSTSRTDRPLSSRQTGEESWHRRRRSSRYWQLWFPGSGDPEVYPNLSRTRFWGPPRDITGPPHFHSPSKRVRVLTFQVPPSHLGDPCE